MIITLCGSTRFPSAFDIANMHLTMRGHVVISVGMKGHSDDPPGARHLCSDGDESTSEKILLDSLHFDKINISDAIYVINVAGYVGSSTKREIEYAISEDKQVFWMFPDAVPPEFDDDETGNDLS